MWRKASQRCSVRETLTRGRGRFWTGIALIGGGAALATLGGLELGESETVVTPPFIVRR
jgi:hypothetical protein